MGRWEEGTAGSILTAVQTAFETQEEVTDTTALPADFLNAGRTRSPTGWLGCGNNLYEYG